MARDEVDRKLTAALDALGQARSRLVDVWFMLDERAHAEEGPTDDLTKAAFRAGTLAQLQREAWHVESEIRNIRRDLRKREK